jgi:hypothetical protein
MSSGEFPVQEGTQGGEQQPSGSDGSPNEQGSSAAAPAPTDTSPPSGEVPRSAAPGPTEAQAAAAPPEQAGASGPPSGTEAPPERDTPVAEKISTEVSALAIDALDGDASFRIRPASELEDVADLATDLARAGQLFPIDVRPSSEGRFQVISGFRRVAALRMLQRERVLARIHRDLSAADAALMALAASVHSRPTPAAPLAEVRERFDRAGLLTPAVKEMIERAVTGSLTLAPEQVEEEVDADELASDATIRLGQLNQDLSLLADVFGGLTPERREALLEQLRYSSQLVAFLEAAR